MYGRCVLPEDDEEETRQPKMKCEKKTKETSFSPLISNFVDVTKQERFSLFSSFRIFHVKCSVPSIVLTAIERGRQEIFSCLRFMAHWWKGKLLFWLVAYCKCAIKAKIWCSIKISLLLNYGLRKSVSHLIVRSFRRIKYLANSSRRSLDLKLFKFSWTKLTKWTKEST